MSSRQIVYDTLDRLKIAYEAIEHPPVYTIEDMERLSLNERGTVAKNLFLRDAKGKRHFLVVLRDDKSADLNSLMTKLESTKLSFASEERLQKYLGLQKGAVSPFGILNDVNCEVEVAFDKDLCGEKKLGVHPNDNTATLFLSFEDIQHVIKEHGNKIKLVNI